MYDLRQWSIPRQKWGIMGVSLSDVAVYVRSTTNIAVFALSNVGVNLWIAF